MRKPHVLPFLLAILVPLATATAQKTNRDLELSVHEEHGMPMTDLTKLVAHVSGKVVTYKAKALANKRVFLSGPAKLRAPTCWRFCEAAALRLGFECKPNEDQSAIELIPIRRGTGRIAPLRAAQFVLPEHLKAHKKLRESVILTTVALPLKDREPQFRRLLRDADRGVEIARSFDGHHVILQGAGAKVRDAIALLRKPLSK